MGQALNQRVNKNKKLIMSTHRFKVLSLYKRIVKVHTKLPYEIRAFADMYSRVEFRRHKECDPKFIPEFMRQWEDYARNTEESIQGNRTLGKDLDPEVAEKLDITQLEQILDLHQETKKSQYQFIVVDEDDDRVPQVVTGCGPKSNSGGPDLGLDPSKVKK